MSGHSKWSTIKRQKAVTDAKRGKIFTRHARAIEVAARTGGGDPESNSALAMAIEAARSDNLPKENITRAIKKGTGELAGESMEEKNYEGYGPGGVAILIKTLTNNPQRTVSNIRHLLAKHGGKLAESGSVAFQFQKLGNLVLEAQTKNTEEIELAAIESGAIDTESAEDFLIIKTNPADLMSVRQKLQARFRDRADIKIKSAELAFEPVNEIKIEDFETARKILKLVEALEEDDDVDSVSVNFDIPDEIMKQIN